jgi:hypothetical protein
MRNCMQRGLCPSLIQICRRLSKASRRNADLDRALDRSGFIVSVVVEFVAVCSTGQPRRKGAFFRFGRHGQGRAMLPRGAASASAASQPPRDGTPAAALAMALSGQLG